MAFIVLCKKIRKVRLFMIFKIESSRQIVHVLEIKQFHLSLNEKRPKFFGNNNCVRASTTNNILHLKGIDFLQKKLNVSHVPGLISHLGINIFNNYKACAFDVTK